MKKYMIINNKYSVEYGKYELTLINFEKGDYYSLNGSQYEIFKQWHKNKPINTDALTEEEEGLYLFLKSSGIASFKDKYYATESYNIGKRIMLYNEKKCKLSRVFIELGSEESSEQMSNLTSPCWVCRSHQKITIPDESIYIRLIEKLSGNGCDQIVLYGGDILSCSSAEAIMKAADEAYIQLCIIVSEDMLTESAIKTAVENNAVLVVTIDLSKTFDINKFMNIYKMLCDKNATAKYSFIISSETMKEYKSYEEKIFSLGAEIVNVSLMMENSISESELSEICMINSVDINEYKIFSSMNTCMAGTIAIDTDLNIIPCPEMKSFSLGKIVYDENSLKFIRKNTEYRLSDFWLNNKNFMQECSICSKKNLCMDCRAAEIRTYEIIT